MQLIGQAAKLLEVRQERFIMFVSSRWRAVPVT